MNRLQPLWNQVPEYQAKAQVYSSEALKWGRQYIEEASYFQLIRDIVFILVVSHFLRRVENTVIIYGVFGAIRRALRSLAQRVFVWFISLPVIRGQVDKVLQKTLDGLEGKVIERSAPRHAVLPEHGESVGEVDKTLRALDKLKRSEWEKGRLSGAVYHGGKELLELQTKVYGEYTVANQLHPDCFPAVRQMEAEVVAMVLDLFHGPEGAVGTSTSGGTESLLLTCLAAREKARVERGITEPEIIAPITIHAGFDKAAYYFNIKLVHAPVDPKTYKVDLKAVERLIGPNTILLAGSAPNFPHGIVDDIAGLSHLAVKHRLPLHVDACLGSFVVPFLKELDVDIGDFDFTLPGVTSISCDTHKYGFAPKGSSIIMYRSKDLCHYQYYVNVEWTGGLYASPTLAGSRPGAIMAGCWATLLHVGKSGYRDSARAITTAARKFRHALETRDVLKENLRVIGDPRVSVVAFTSDKINIYDLSDRMASKGWHLNALQNPAAIHLAVTRLTLKVLDELVEELSTQVRELAASDSAPPKDGTRALYGVAGSVQGSGIAQQIACGFIDFLYAL